MKGFNMDFNENEEYCGVFCPDSKSFLESKFPNIISREELYLWLQGEINKELLNFIPPSHMGRILIKSVKSNKPFDPPSIYWRYVPVSEGPILSKCSACLGTGIVRKIVNITETVKISENMDMVTGIEKEFECEICNGTGDFRAE